VKEKSVLLLKIILLVFAVKTLSVSDQNTIITIDMLSQLPLWRHSDSRSSQAAAAVACLDVLGSE
jgi:hypothetical protein